MCGSFALGTILALVLLLGITLVTFPEALIEPYLLLLNLRTTTTLEVHGAELWTDGIINHKTYDQFVRVLEQNPQITTLVEGQMPGSIDDDTMIKLAYYIHDQGLDTHLRSTSQIDSGAVDLFLVGMERTMERGAHIGVHSWSDGSNQAKDIPRDHPDHRQNAEYVRDMLGSEDFYWYTIYASPADRIHEMTEEEILKYGLLSQPVMAPRSTGLPGVLASKTEAQGNPDAEMVIVYEQSGPQLSIQDWSFGSFFPSLDSEKAYLLNVYQEQTFAPYLYHDTPINQAQAQNSVTRSTQILMDLIRYYVDDGRQVLVVGTDFGALVVQNALAQQGNIATGYLLAGGRLETPEDAWKMLTRGQGVGFEDGNFTATNLARIARALAAGNYTRLLAETPFDNVVFIDGKQNERVGSLTTAEVSFIEKKQGRILVTDGGTA